ncbi:MAG: protoheme IX farnesyltransferase [Phycisphaerales bacterium]|nr:MAG: protoheme IX farnesyltransferase [Phycisphaerales bacterium]
MDDSTAKTGNAARSGLLKIILDLTKVRITFAVTLTTATGYFLAVGRADGGLVLVLVGVFLLSCGSAAFNEIQERKIDARMPRTRNRPLPAGHIQPSTALFISLLLILLGLYTLASIKQNLTVLLFLAGLALLWYNGFYTYLKRVTAFAVVPGALIGAIPPVMGYAAAGGEPTDPPILLVASFFFIWQIPHFWLLLLMFGDQYRQADLPTLTGIFSRPQLLRITFMWILATAAGGLVFPALSGFGLRFPWNLAIVIASFWLIAKAWRVLRPPTNAEDRTIYRRAFIHINIYALMVMICLSLNAVGLIWS